MKKILIIILVAFMLLTACSSEPKPEVKEYPPYGDKGYIYRDENGHIIKEKLVFATIEDKYMLRYYDETDTYFIRTELYNNDDELLETYDMEYDEEGNKIKSTFRDSEGHETRQEMTYEEGKMIYRATYWSGVLGREEYYDEQEYTKMTKSYEDGVLYEWSVPVYDETGGGSPIAHLFYRADDTIKLMQEYCEDEKGEFYTLKTEYDENEEIIKITKSYTGHEEIVFER